MFTQNNINWVVAGGALLTILTFVAGKFGITIPDDVKQAILVLILALTGGGVVALHNIWNVPATRQKAQDLLVQAGNVPIGKAQDLVKILVIALFLPLFLIGCTSINGLPVPGTAPGSITDQLKELSQYTQADLDIAEADAVAHDDTVSAPCYPALKIFIQSIPGVTTVGGAFANFQKARDLRNFAAGGLPKYLVIGCGPLYAEVHGDLLLFLSQVAPVRLPINPTGG